MNLLQTKELPFAPVVSMKRLSALLHRDRKDIERIASHAGRYYEPFDRHRPGSSKWRHIDNPVGELKDLQSSIYRAIFATYSFPLNVIGGIPGRSTKHNMNEHLGRPVLVTLDIKNCFPHIHDFHHVYPTFRRLGFPPELAELLTKLTTFQHRLPQGAPSSPIIANLVLEPVHRAIDKIARVYGLHWSMYVDDIAISGVRARHAIVPIIRALQREGYGVANQKIRVMSNSERQALTGGVVNREKISAGREQIEEIRNAIFELHDRDGIIFDHEIRSVRGRINNVKWLRPVQGATLLRLADKMLPQPNASGRRASGERRTCNSFSRDHNH
jgi:RNA-directed DNA polymerase